MCKYVSIHRIKMHIFNSNKQSSDDAAGSSSRYFNATYEQHHRVHADADTRLQGKRRTRSL